ncbi:MAG: flagellar basal-body rod protein FlgG [Acidobacteriaceae bacterium]|nr:flagellar basal-body rod protein FlgG [Acidobacteriaceae bacterium]MBV9308876.1 flagellar basal-body rod protein FlgG [Acidobacteriaceae bacterium]
MIRALNSAASGMTAQQLNLDSIANNLANSSTAGFKARRAQFQDLLYQNMIQPGSAAGQQTTMPAGLQIGLGTRTVSNEIVFSQGNMTQTENNLDLAIQGKGFFQIRRPSGDLAYTRSGLFQLDRNGNMVTAEGDPIEPQITIPANALSVTIGQDGTVSYMMPGQSAAQKAGQIQLATFQNPAGLNSLGNSLFQPTDASGDPVVGNPGGSEGLGTVMQGYSEQSNVNVVEEFVNLIQSQRAYESNSRVVKAADEMYQQINQITQ